MGLCHREMPLRRALLASALIGLLCLTAGNPATLGSLVDGPVRDLLDGPLAPFRNIHKVDPLVRLPLALGAAHAAVLLLRRLEPRRDLRRATAVALAALVIGSGAPLLTGDLRMPGFREVPEAWTQAADYLEQQPDSRALVLPGSGFGLQTWGWTIDEPLQGVASSAWVTRSQVPLVPGPTARYLDTIERRIASGEGGEGLADAAGPRRDHPCRAAPRPGPAGGRDGPARPRRARPGQLAGPGARRRLRQQRLRRPGDDRGLPGRPRRRRSRSSTPTGSTGSTERPTTC